VKYEGYCNNCDYDFNYAAKWRRNDLRNEERNAYQRLLSFIDWSEVARQDRRHKSELARLERELQDERLRLATLELEESQARALDHFSPAWSLAFHAARATLLSIMLLGPLLHMLIAGWVWPLIAVLVILATLAGGAYDYRLAAAKASGLRGRGQERLAAWREYTGVGEFGPLEPEIGYRLTVPCLRELADEEAGTVSVDFCEREIEWRADGWRDRGFRQRERLLVEDEAVIAERWADFCAALAEKAREQGQAACAAEMARLEETALREAQELERRDRLALHAGIGERLALPVAKSGYLP
jgi:uncharacterized membrane protein YqjE